MPYTTRVQRSLSSSWLTAEEEGIQCPGNCKQVEKKEGRGIISNL